MIEVEALKRAIAEAEEKAVTERTLRDKHEPKLLKLSRSCKRP